MEKKVIKVAVAGAGYWGKNLVRVFHELGALGCICDLDPETARNMGGSYPKVKCTSSYAGVLKDKDISAVVIATPAETHFRMAKEAMLAGKDVFVEKPLSITAKEGAELVKLSLEKRSVLMVGHLLEYHPAVNKLKELVDKGELGKINYIYSNRLNLGKIRREENILWSFAPHDISVILCLLGEVPESVGAYGGNYLHKDIADVTVSNLSFKSGVKGHIFVSWLHPYKEQKLVVVGEKKMAVFDDVAPKDKLLLFSHKIDWIGRIPVPKKEDAQAVDFKMEEPLSIECSHFLDCVRSRKSPKTDGASALKVLKVLQACQMSLEKNGESVALMHDEPLQREGFFVHPSALVDEPVQIGKGTKVWHYSHVMKGARIGESCVIGQNVFIGSKAVLGNNVKVQNNVSIYDRVKLGDDVFCGPSMVFTNVINPRSHIERKDEYRETVVGKGATLGANCTIVCGHTIGNFAFIGAGAVVTKDVPDYGLVYGNPARIQGWMCQCGVGLKFAKNRGKCAACSKEYLLKNGRILPAKEK